jgi:dipeptidyl aminopeptidase/acylaminoacyl peptidase
MRILLLGILFVIINPLFADTLPLEFFAKRPQFNSLKLSPDGKYFAATVPKKSTTNLVIINRKTMKVIRAYGFGHDEHISSFYWANNERLVYKKSYKIQGIEKLSYRGELFSANVDGTKRVQLFGYSSNKSKNAYKRSIQAWGNIVHMLPEDENHILVRSSKWSTDSDSPDKIYKINIYNQKRTLITKAPLGNIRVLSDMKGNLVVASGKDRDGEKRKYFYRDNQWEAMPKEHPLFPYSFLAMNNDSSLMYVSKAIKRGTKGLYQYDTKTQKISLLYNHKTVDYSGLIRTPATKSIIGVETMFAGIDYHYIDLEHPFSKIHQQLAATFPNNDITITANSTADNEMIVKIVSDKTPGNFYLFNQEKQSIELLIRAKSWINPNQMMNKKLIQFTARDGQTIYGYLTVPADKNTPHPLIVDVHGGPFGSQDKWHYDTSSQMWANNGFAVLKINFRGSGGYGENYEKIAYLKRSTLIQQDIIDGTRWALALENISDNNVCITGGSFGGYSALMAPLIEPELYKCAIPMYGAYDVLYQMENADYMGVDSVSVGAKEKYGDNEKFWRKESPLTYIDKLKTPLLIVTGGRDKRVPPQSAFNLKAALDQRRISYEWLYKEEGHGFVGVKNKVELFKKSIAFANKHLKP